MAKLKYSRSDVVIAAMCLLIIPQALHCLRTGGTSAGHKSIARGIPCALRLKKAPSRRSRVFMCGNDFTHDPNTGKRPSTWSNIGGNNIIKIADSLWCAERPFVWNGIDVGGRMVVVKLSDGSLWVHSPVGLDEPLRNALEEIGPVAHIVSPNFEHVRYAGEWKEAFPEARSYACPGLAERRPEVDFCRSVGDAPGDGAPREWGGEILACFLDTEHNPFTRKPFFNEVVFYHPPTRALITADLYWNYPTQVPKGTRVWKWGMDKVYLPFYKRFMVKDQGRFEAKLDEILGWGVEMIVPCHGSIVPSGGGKMLLETLLGKDNR